MHNIDLTQLHTNSTLPALRYDHQRFFFSQQYWTLAWKTFYGANVYHQVLMGNSCERNVVVINKTKDDSVIFATRNLLGEKNSSESVYIKIMTFDEEHILQQPPRETVLLKPGSTLILLSSFIMV